ncbi:MAG: aminopeptidase [Clostridiales bacterium]|nr:aminopeptidase [Candidatus Cacconaster stercorequi]
MKKTVLRKYAQLIACSGVNVQPGQEVFIQAELDQPEFVKMLVEECYRCKAKKVVVDWSYQPLQKLHYRYRTLTTLGQMDNYEEARWQHYVDTIPCRIYLLSEDPDGLRGINQEKMAKAQQKRYPIIKQYRDKIENKYQWCIAAVPGAAWAKKLFPELRTSQAVEKLWEAILSTSRVTDDPIQAWQEHNRDLHARCEYLNNLHIEKLHYTASNGTDLTVGMIPQAQFCGGGEESLQGIFFNPNIPTEECFISPKRGEAEGIVYATKPLSYQGQLIENFSIRFHEGKAVEWHAEKNEALLEKLITMDEGSAYLGECALVPYDSPICQSGLLFYNTLFDENAACHLALGMGFADTIRDFRNKTLEECRALGVNDSMVHEDFMIGSADMDIDAICADGKTVAIFRKGNWAF